jgi:hypothetical protein
MLDDDALGLASGSRSVDDEGRAVRARVRSEWLSECWNLLDEVGVQGKDIWGDGSKKGSMLRGADDSGSFKILQNALDHRPGAGGVELSVRATCLEHSKHGDDVPLGLVETESNLDLGANTQTSKVSGKTGADGVQLPVGEVTVPGADGRSTRPLFSPSGDNMVNTSCHGLRDAAIPLENLLDVSSVDGIQITKSGVGLAAKLLESKVILAHDSLHLSLGDDRLVILDFNAGCAVVANGAEKDQGIAVKLIEVSGDSLDALESFVFT